MAVVCDPLVVEMGLAFREPPIDGLAVDLGRPSPIRAVELRGVVVTRAVGLAALVVARGDAS